MGAEKVIFKISGENKIKRCLIENDVLAHPTWLCKKTFYSDLNEYRNILACEDYDLLLRALKKGMRMDNLSQIVLDYRKRESSISRSNTLRQQVTTFYILKHHKIIDEIDEETIRDSVDALCQRELAKNRMTVNEDLINRYKQQKKYISYILYWLKFSLDGQINHAFVKNVIKYKLRTLRIRG